MISTTAAHGSAQAIRSAQRFERSPQQLAFLVAGLLLAAVSLSLAGMAGWTRGATPFGSVVWSTAGVALAIVSLTGLSVAVASSKGRHMALLAWLLALAFTIIAALGSQHGGRELAARTETANTGDRARHQAAYDTAASELAALPAARPVAVIEAELAAVLKDERLNGCTGWLANKRLRTVCIERVEPARAELANAQERARLTSRMGAATAALTTPVAKPANTDAAAVARYLAAIGMHVAPERLADLISLLTVVALEVCGAVCLALGRVPQQADGLRPTAEARATNEPVKQAESGHDRGGNQPMDSTPVPSAPGDDSERIPEESTESERRQRVIDRLKAGALEGRQIDMAKELGIPVTSLRRLAESDDRVRLMAFRNGSRLELVAA